MLYLFTIFSQKIIGLVRDRHPFRSHGEPSGLVGNNERKKLYAQGEGNEGNRATLTTTQSASMSQCLTYLMCATESQCIAVTSWNRIPQYKNISHSAN